MHKCMSQLNYSLSQYYCYFNFDDQAYGTTKYYVCIMLSPLSIHPIERCSRKAH